MTELSSRVSAMEASLLKTCAPQEKIIEALTKLSGLEVTHLSDEVRESIESHLSDINRILKKFKIETFEDYGLYPERGGKLI